MRPNISLSKCHGSLCDLYDPAWFCLPQLTSSLRRQVACYFERAVGVEGMERTVLAVDDLAPDALLRRVGIGPAALQGCAALAARGPSVDLISASPSALRGGARCGWLLRRTNGVKMPGAAAGAAPPPRPPPPPPGSSRCPCMTAGPRGVGFRRGLRSVLASPF